MPGIFLDAFIVSDELAKLAPLRGTFRNGGDIPAIKILQNKLNHLMRMQPEFQGLKPGKKGKLTFRVFTKKEWQRYGKTPFKLFTK